MNATDFNQPAAAQNPVIRQEKPHAFPAGLFCASILSVFFLFSALGTALSLFFPTVLAYGSPAEVARFYFTLKIKIAALAGLGILTFLTLKLPLLRAGADLVPVPDIPGPRPFSFKKCLLFTAVTGALFTATVFGLAAMNDEGMYANVARNAALYSRYAFGQIGYFQDFSPYISVGPTVILPLAMIYKYAGDGMLWTRAYVFLWLLLASGALFALYRRFLHGVKFFLALLLALLFLQTADVKQPLSGLMGEMPALFFISLSVLFMPAFREKEKAGVKLFFSALFLGLAIVTKTTLVIFLSLPFIGLLYAGLFKKRKLLLFGFISLAGLAASLAPWVILKTVFSNTSMSQDNLYTYSQFLLFGVQDISGVIFRYGPANFLKLMLLALAATCSLNRCLKQKEFLPSCALMYGLALYFMLWFFTSTDGHFIRYTVYPILMLIPLAVQIIPEKIFAKPSGLAGLAFALIFLFYAEWLSVFESFTGLKYVPQKWMAEALQEKMAPINEDAVVWTLNVFDERALSASTRPPVFLLKEEMLGPGGENAEIPEKYRRPRQGDVLAFGVDRGHGPGRDLYLMHILKAPESPGNVWLIAGKIPIKAFQKLNEDLTALGASYRFISETPKEKNSGYILIPVETLPKNGA